MASTTTNYNLHKIDLTDAPPDITTLNSNWDTIDTNLHGASTNIDALTDQLSATFDGVDLLEVAKTLPRGIYYFKANCTNRPVTTNNVGFHVIVMNRNPGETSPVVKIMAFAYASNEIYFNTISVDSHDWIGWESIYTTANKPYTCGTNDLTAGTSELATGTVYFVYE